MDKPSNVIIFTSREGAQNSANTTGTQGVTDGVQRFLETIRNIPLLPANGLPVDEPSIGDFFDILTRTRALFIELSGSGTIMPSDMVYVLSDPTADEFDNHNDRYELSVERFLQLIYRDGDGDRSICELLENYANQNRIALGQRSEDNPHGEDEDILVAPAILINQSEETPMSDNSPGTTGYSYAIENPQGGCAIPAENFDITNKEIQPLLFLMLEAASEYDKNGVEGVHQIVIHKYNNAPNPSQFAKLTYGELLEAIDASIQRVTQYSIIWNSISTMAGRRKAVYHRYVQTFLDPHRIAGGGYMADIDEEV